MRSDPAPSLPPPEDDVTWDLDPSIYLESRLRLLAKVAGDHAHLEHHLAVMGCDDFFARWTDGEGQPRLYEMTPNFLDAHCHVLISLIDDVDRLGPHYRALAGRIVAEQFRAVDRRAATSSDDDAAEAE